MGSRREVLKRIAELAGPEVLRVQDPATGWPGYGDVIVEGVARPVALWVGPVGLSYRERDDIERRFQNPGGDREIVDTRPTRAPLLLGLWESDEVLAVPRPVLVSADPVRRFGRTTRFSVFADVPTLVAAAATGWAEDVNAAGEQVTCFLPDLLSVSLLAQSENASPDVDAIRTAVSGAGLLDTPSDAEVDDAAHRVRRTATALVRQAGFGRRVVDAYGGRCAMCGFGSGFPQGAHIYPVAAPGSTDQLSNGLSLCPNHHHAFDRHLVAVDPGTLAIHKRPDAVIAARSQAAKLFFGSTRAVLMKPAFHAATPSPAMFAKRYAFFAPSYEWLPF